MRSIMGQLAIAFAITGLPSSASATEKPLTLEPSSGWNVNYGDDHCRLARSFGEGEQQIILLIDRFNPDEKFSLKLLGSPMKRTQSDGVAEIGFGPITPETPARKLNFYVGTWGKADAWIFSGGIALRPWSKSAAPITPQEEAAVTEISIGRPLRQLVRLNTGPMDKAFAAMRACTDELLTHWGIDVERHRQRASGPEPKANPASWMTDNDYPPGLSEKGLPGIVQFRLVIGKDGVPTSCHIQQTTNPASLDGVVCKAMMKNARFKPAVGADGEPLVSYFASTVNFKIR